MKISIIGAGNVGSTTALRLLNEQLADVILVDVAKGIAQGKTLDLEDARHVLGIDYSIKGTEDINEIKNSDIVVITAGLARRPGMTREELLTKNAQIVKEISGNIKKSTPKAIVLVVSNPLDLMSYLALKVTGFERKKIIGVGMNLDASRFANLISKELNIAVCDIEPCVVGSHGQEMLPLERFTKVRGRHLSNFLDPARIKSLIEKTVGRGAEIVSFLGNGSAYFAPSAAICATIKIILEDKKAVVGVCAYLEGEYGLRNVSIGVPCRLGKAGIEEIIELDLNKEEKETFLKSAENLRKQYSFLPIEWTPPDSPS